MSVLPGFALLAAVTLNPTDRLVYDSIVEPRVTGVPPAFALRYLTWTESGALRCYGEDFIASQVRRVYVESRDLGLTWKTYLAAAEDPGAMVKSPLSGDWFTLWEDKWGGPYRIIRSRLGPGDVNADRVSIDLKGFNFFRQPQYLPVNRRWAITAGCAGQTPSILFSDDDGLNWRRVTLTNRVSTVGTLIGADKSARWDNLTCEPTLLERKDGTLMLLCRTAFDHPYLCRSKDGGLSWEGPVEVPWFWMSNTMPTYFRLSDGRVLLFWNNNQPLPKRDPAEYPELGSGELAGRGETVFTNRDVLHAAISEDDGESWIGFREILLNPIRNREDFREQGNHPPLENDKSVHQEQALELPGGKVLLHAGQNSVARRFVIFDPKWLYETGRAEDFRYGTDGLSNYLFVKSLSGNQRGWAGHCAWNRIPGAILKREPDTGRKTVRESLHLARIPDPRLVTDRQGVAWNFPTARKGSVELDCRLDGKEFYLALSDHFIVPSDEINFNLSPVVFRITPAVVGRGHWLTVKVDWNADTGKTTLFAGSRAVATANIPKMPRFGFSYLHLRATEEADDLAGTYFRAFRKK